MEDRQIMEGLGEHCLVDVRGRIQGNTGDEWQLSLLRPTSLQTMIDHNSKLVASEPLEHQCK